MNRYRTPFWATILGGLGLFFWSTTGWMAVQLERIPPFQFLMITQFVTFSLALSHLSAKHAWRSLCQPPLFWLVGAVCVPLNLLGYFWAFRFIQPAQADLIYYIYPIHILLIGSLLLGYRISPRALVGVLVGFLGDVFKFGIKVLGLGGHLIFCGRVLELGDLYLMHTVFPERALRDHRLLFWNRSRAGRHSPCDIRNFCSPHLF